MGQLLLNVLAAIGTALMFIIGVGNAIVRNENALRQATDHPNSFSGIILTCYNYLFNSSSSLSRSKKFWIQVDKAFAWSGAEA